MRTPHQNLIESYPELASSFSHLKINDPHFQQILKEYETLDNQINHIDNGGGAVEPLHFEELKKKRVHFKDQVYQHMLHHSKNSAYNPQ